MQFNKELFGNRLKEARNKRKLSQEELSKLTGISVSFVSNSSFFAFNFLISPLLCAVISSNAIGKAWHPE